MIAKFEVLNPIPDKTKAHYNKRGELVIPNIATCNYRWYMEVARNNLVRGDREYFILFGITKFDNNCVKLLRDYTQHFVVTLEGEFGDFVRKELAARGNVNVTYLYSEDTFDVWLVE